MNKIEKITKINKEDLTQILGVWESAVKATHDFLNEEQVAAIKPQVEMGANYVDAFAVIRDEENQIQAFIGVHEGIVEMLFVHNDMRGKGLGKQLLNYAINNHDAVYVDVNEQNPQGLGFYEAMGFETFKRSELDGHGDPYPILHMKLKQL